MVNRSENVISVGSSSSIDHEVSRGACRIPTAHYCPSDLADLRSPRPSHHNHHLHHRHPDPYIDDHVDASQHPRPSRPLQTSSHPTSTPNRGRNAYTPCPCRHDQHRQHSRHPRSGRPRWYGYDRAGAGAQIPAQVRWNSAWKRSFRVSVEASSKAIECKAGAAVADVDGNKALGMALVTS